MKVTAAQLAALSLVAVLAGCGGGDGGGKSATSIRPPQPRAAAANADNGRFLVALTRLSDRPKTDSPVRFRLTATTARGRGEPAYEVSFGDGKAGVSHRAGCGASKRLINRSTWQFAHAYGKPGVYRVRATVNDKCNGYSRSVSFRVPVGR